MLKPKTFMQYKTRRYQPPSGGCVLKPHEKQQELESNHQPPSGGCVLKQVIGQVIQISKDPAAFGRLCVETSMPASITVMAMPSRLRAAVC